MNFKRRSDFVARRMRRAARSPFPAPLFVLLRFALRPASRQSKGDSRPGNARRVARASALAAVPRHGPGLKVLDTAILISFSRLAFAVYVKLSDGIPPGAATGGQPGLPQSAAARQAWPGPLAQGAERAGPGPRHARSGVDRPSSTRHHRRNQISTFF